MPAARALNKGAGRVWRQCLAIVLQDEQGPSLPFLIIWNNSLQRQREILLRRVSERGGVREEKVIMAIFR